MVTKLGDATSNRPIMHTCVVMPSIALVLAMLLHTALMILPASAQGPDPNDRVTFVQDGEFSKALHIPTYEWIPKNTKPERSRFGDPRSYSARQTL